MSERIAKSLAGRVRGVTLLPLSIAELESVALLPGDLDTLLVRGFYPAQYGRELAPALMLANYVNTCLERDVGQIQAVRDWLSILQASSIITLLQPYRVNLAAL